MKHLTVVAVLAFALSGCSSSFIVEALEKGNDVSDKTIQKAADAYDAYCNTIPETAREAINRRFNEATVDHDMPDWCPEAE